MSDELRKAVERLRGDKAGTFKYGPPIFNPLHLLPRQFVEDLMKVRNAYLVEHPPAALGISLKEPNHE